MHYLLNSSRVIASLLWRGGALSATLLGAALLEPDAFGQLAVALAVSTVVSQCAAFGLVNLLNRELSNHVHRNRLFMTVFEVFAAQVGVAAFAFLMARHVLGIHPFFFLHGVVIAFANITFCVLSFRSSQRVLLGCALVLGLSYLLLIEIAGEVGAETALAVQALALLPILIGVTYSSVRCAPSGNAEKLERISAIKDSAYFGAANLMTLPLLMGAVIATARIEGDVRAGELALGNAARNAANFYVLQLASVLPAILGRDASAAASVLRRVSAIAPLSALGLSIIACGFYVAAGNLEIMNALLVVAASGLQAVCVIDGVRLLLNADPSASFKANLAWATSLIFLSILSYLLMSLLNIELAIAASYFALLIFQRSMLFSVK